MNDPVEVALVVPCVDPAEEFAVAREFSRASRTGCGVLLDTRIAVFDPGDQVPDRWTRVIAEHAFSQNFWTSNAALHAH